MVINSSLMKAKTQRLTSSLKGNVSSSGMMEKFRMNAYPVDN